MDAFESLTASYFDGRLTERKAAELARVVDNDVEKAARFVGEYEIDRLLALRSIPADESRIEAILAQIQQEDDPFVQSVFGTIERENSAPTGRVQSWRNWVAPLFSRPGWALLAAACVGLLGCAWFFYYGTTAGEPRLQLAENLSIDMVRNGVSTLAQHGFALRTGDVLSVPGTNSATICFAPEKTRIAIRPGTELKLVSVSGAKRFVLDGGKIEASVARQRTFKPMIIVTPQAEARVLGTHFTLAAYTNATRLEVLQGKVKFTRTSDGKPVKVKAGNYAVAAANYELAALPACGRILRQYWTNIPAGEITITLMWHPRYPNHPDGAAFLTRFESPPNSARNLGERIVGYLHCPKTGDYTFWIAVSNDGQLWLSRDDKPENKMVIAYTTPTNQRSQQSSAITLVAGHKYYIEAVAKPDIGNDRVAVAWQRPGGERQIIPGEFLSAVPIAKRRNK